MWKSVGLGLVNILLPSCAARTEAMKVSSADYAYNTF